MKFFTKWRKLIFVMVMAIFIFGCGQEKEKNTKELKTTISMDIDSLNPYKIVSSGSEEIMFNVFEGLVMPGADGSLKPAIAENWKISDDGKTYTFKIRKGVKFHNGKELTPQDVVFSLKRMAGKDGMPPVKALLGEMQDIKVVGDDEVEITLPAPNSAFIYSLTMGIVPEENKDNLDKNPIGTGPFKVGEYSREQKIVLDKFDDYWGDKAKLDKVTVYITPNNETAFLKLLSGEIDMLSRVDAKRIKELNDFNNVYGPQNTVQIFALNNSIEPFNDIRVRKAINYALDKDEIIKNVMNGNGKKLETNMSPVMKKYAIENIGQKQDIEKAKELLKESGHENFTFTIKVPSNYSLHVNTAQVIAEQLKQVGINAKIETVEWATWLSDVYNGRKYEATIVGLSGKLDPYAILRRYTKNYKNNFFNFDNPQYDQLIENAKNSTDDKTIVENYKKAQEILRDEQAAIYIMDPELMTSLKKNIKGFEYYPTPFINFANMSFGE